MSPPFKDIHLYLITDKIPKNLYSLREGFVSFLFPLKPSYNSGIANTPAITGISCKPSDKYSHPNVPLDTFVTGLVPINAKIIPKLNPISPKYHFLPNTSITLKKDSKVIIQSSFDPTYKYMKSKY